MSAKTPRTHGPASLKQLLPAAAESRPPGKRTDEEKQKAELDQQQIIAARRGIGQTGLASDLAPRFCGAFA
jgi:hypothetical protein